MTTLHDTIQNVQQAVRANDRVLLHQMFVSLMQLQDTYARHREDALHHGLPVRREIEREDGIDWKIWVCTCGCGDWGTRW